MELAGAPAGEAQFQRARLLVGALVQAGVRRVVTSPGSHSTPLVLAALELAGREERGPEVELASIADERAAAFFALGQARATGMPTGVICTSGSAPAHYLPAILEAREAGVPLIALTADRPIELMDCAAPQTTDQTRLFGSAVNHFAEVDLGGRVDALSLRALRRAAVQVAFRARWPRPGAVHVNVRARKPLEREADASGGALAAAVDALLGESIEAGVPLAEPSPAALDRAAALSRQADRGLIVAGALPLPSPARRRGGGDVFGLVELARRTGFPLLAEATSQSRFGDGDGLAEAARLGAARVADGGETLPLPDLILQIGAPPVSADTQRLMEASGAPRLVISDGPWTDPEGSASVFLFGDLERTVPALCRRLGESGPGAVSGGWRDGVLALGGRFRAAAAKVRAASAGFHDGQAARTAVAATPPGGLLMLGNSLPVRLVETWADRPGHRVWVASQRGLSGIDGLVAGFLGSLDAGGFPAGVLLLGDVSLLHDLAGLAIAPEYGDGPPAVVVVIDNGGGRIFERLPIAGTEVFRGPEGRHWLTPPRVDFGGLAQAFGVPCARAEDASALKREIGEALGRRGLSLVVASVAPGALAEAEESLRRAMAATPSA